MIIPKIPTPKPHINSTIIHSTVNLLYDTFARSKKRESTMVSLTMFATSFIFILLGTAILIWGTMYLNTTKNRNKTLKQNIKKLTPTIELLYNIQLRKQYLTESHNPYYSPANIIKALNLIITPEGRITSYQLNSQGDINIRITTDSTYKAAIIWLYLITNKQIITQLNLHSFTFDTANNSIDFTLRGKLDIKEISEIYADKTK